MRKLTKEVHVGNIKLGNNNPIVVQTMANIKTSKIDEILSLEERLSKIGNKLLRLSVLDEDDANAFKILSKKSNTPLIADIHFNINYAIQAIENGAKAIRINPGNMKKEDVYKLIPFAKKHDIAIRIGVNSGSIGQGKKATLDNMILSMRNYVSIFEESGFTNLVLSLKSSDPNLTKEVYFKASEVFPYPLHLGVTEAGGSYFGAIKSCIGLIPLLENGIGDTIRISLCSSPEDEVLAAYQLLKGLNLITDFPNLVCCPTCGRTQVDLKRVYQLVLDKVKYVKKDIKIAIMGCPVNGPGEAKDADIGLAGGVDHFLIFKKGKPVANLCEDEALVYLFNEIDNF